MKLNETAQENIDKIFTPAEREILESDMRRGQRSWSLDELERLLNYAILIGYSLDLDNQEALFQFFYSFHFISTFWIIKPEKLEHHLNKLFELNQGKSMLMTARQLYLGYYHFHKIDKKKIFSGNRG